jgi:beta-phosphoglucomutase-like phosphatase (HAD superfamily)
MCLKALIFDVDGTLADTECDGHRVAFNRAFKRYGLDWSWSKDFYGNLLKIGGGKERIRHFIETNNPALPPSFRSESISALHRLKNELYGEILQKGEISLRPGVLRLLQAARSQSLLLAIATTSSLSNTLGLIQYHFGPDAASWFTVIGAGDIVPQKKPASDIYDYVLTQLNLPPESCLVFEDSEVGVKAAHGAGLTIVMTINGYTQTHSFEHAALVVNHLGDLDQPCGILSGSVKRFPGLINLDVCQQLMESA